MCRICFFGNKQQLKAFFAYLEERWGSEACLVDLPTIVCR
jgi:hypothetical protein